MTTPGDQDLSGAGQLVVDTTYEEAVMQALDDLGIVGVETDRADSFDLALLDLTHKERQRENENDEGKILKVADLDPVLAELRVRLAAQCGGWVPPLGKNRPMNSQFGAYPQTKSHALWDPVRVDRAPERWLEGDAGTDIRIGLVDTTVPHHDSIPDSSVETFSPDKIVVQSNDEIYFEAGHGLFMAGLILHQAPKAKLFARAALRDTGKADAWSVVKKMEEFYNDKPPTRVHVLVLASGCRTYDGKAPLILERAIERLNRRMTVVAAAGNHGAVVGMTPDLQITRHSPTWPAALPDVVAAGLPTPFDGADASEERFLDYSPKLPWVTCTVNPSAPGEANGEFISTYLPSKQVRMRNGHFKDLDSGFASWRGTSCAAARLGGVIAARMASDKSDARTAFEAIMAPDGDPKIRPYKWEYRKDDPKSP